MSQSGQTNSAPRRARPFSSEAAQRGGQSKSWAKLDAAARARARKTEANEQRRAALTVPEPFTSAQDFLAVIRQLTLATGAGRELADHCHVSTSTVSKWLRGAKIPLQPNLDLIISWWRSNRDRNPAPKSAQDIHVVARQAPTVSLSRLPDTISARLRMAARRRNLQPIDYAAQILDRHLPSLEEMQ